MAKFSTPYDTLLRVRRIEEDRAKAEMATAAIAERHARGVLDTRLGEYPDLVRPPDAETTLADFRRHQASADAAASSVTLARSAVESAHEQTESARDELRQAAMRTQGLERLVERAHQERFAEMLDADQLAAEESASRRKKGRR
ncbi:MAG: flagellar FliJ family protein [Mobilicoccus sp.]|nr:flagellar FliJ family protein [Mobilicoccus sp.]